jgi:AraC-like DNA-binding protein
MRSQILGPLLSFVRERGGNADELIRAHDLPPNVESASDVELALPAFQALFAEAEQMLGDPMIGIHFAMQLPRGRYGMLEFACRTAPTVQDALRLVVRYGTLVSELIAIELEEFATGAILREHVEGSPLGFGRQGNEFWIGVLLLGARKLTHAPCAPLRIWFPHAAPPPEGLAELAAFYGTSAITFGAAETGMEVDRAFLDTPNLASDPTLLSVLEREVERRISEAPPRAPGLRGEVRARIKGALRGHAPTLPEIARALATSPRTLQRRLAEEGTTLAKELDAVRADLARAHVLERKLPLGEIAFLLGYAELSTFLRAFKRWTGTTPTQLRAG